MSHMFAGRDVNWLLDLRAQTRGSHLFLVWEPFVGARRAWTYGEFRARSLRVAAGLQERGVKPGDFVLVHLDNSPELEILWFACARIGAVVVTTNTRSSADEMAYFADNCGAVAAITSPEYAEMVASAARHVRWVAVTDHLADGTPAPSTLSPDRASRFDAIDADPSGLRAVSADPMRPNSVQYTSGTTSRPKGVLWNHANALWGARTCAVHETLVASDVHHVVLPTFHTNARTYSILSSMWAGGTVVLQPKFSASRFWDVAQRNRCTWMSAIPFVFKALIANEMPKTHHFRMLGASACDPPFTAPFGVKTVGWWGMTETISHGIVGDALLPDRPLSTGRPAAGYGIRVLDDHGNPVSPGETGHLQCRGATGIEMFVEYLGNAKATRESWTDDGWFITGDRVAFDADGYITFADRDKDMLKVGGENVAASEIERVILGVPGVGETAVVAQKHAMLDEVPVAFVIPAPAASAAVRAGLAEAIGLACRDKLADFKRPRQVFVVEEMPRSTLEKVNKAELRKRLPPA